MKIALVHPTFSLLGGTERYGLDLAKALHDMGDEVTLVGQLEGPLPEGFFFDGEALEPPPPEEKLPEGIQVRRLIELPATRAVGRLAFAARTARAVRKLRRKEGVEVVLGLGRTLEQDVLRLGGGCHRSYLETVEGWRDGKPPSPYRLQADHRLSLAIERQQMRLDRTRHLIAVSQRVKDEIMANYPVLPERITVIRNGVDLERFNPKSFEGERDAIRSELGLPPDSFVLLFIGNGLKRKGYSTALAAFADFAIEARQAGNTAPLRLLVVSRDAEKQHLEASYLARLTVLDGALCFSKPLQEIEKAYAAADTLVAPTRYDPFANVCLEAMAMGLPVATTRANGASELFEGKDSALILEDPEDAIGLVRSLRSLLNPNRYAQLSELGRKLASEHSTMHNAKAVRNLLKETLDSKSEAGGRG